MQILSMCPVPSANSWLNSMSLEIAQKTYIDTTRAISQLYNFLQFKKIFFLRESSIQSSMQVEKEKVLVRLELEIFR